MLRCPSCGTPAFLTAYTIERDGTVNPEFDCERPLCEFQAELRLIGWQDSGDKQSVG